MSDPVIGIVCCQKELDGYALQSVTHLYINAIRDFSGIPVLLPGGGTEQEVMHILQRLDGVLLTGSYSNVAPHHYNGTHIENRQDPGRDALSFSLIRLCKEHNIPILGICRGFQEMNVALGGSLHPFVHKLEGFNDHREPETDNMAEKYAPVHVVELNPDGLFFGWAGGKKQIEVNSLHNQGINVLAAPLSIECCAEDGLIEAFSIPMHAFFVGVQWHPEWQAKSNAFSVQLFRRFIEKARSLGRKQRHGITRAWSKNSSDAQAKGAIAEGVG